MWNYILNIIYDKYFKSHIFGSILPQKQPFLEQINNNFHLDVSPKNWFSISVGFVHLQVITPNLYKFGICMLGCQSCFCQPVSAFYHWKQSFLNEIMFGTQTCIICYPNFFYRFFFKYDEDRPSTILPPCDSYANRSLLLRNSYLHWGFRQPITLAIREKTCAESILCFITKFDKKFEPLMRSDFSNGCKFTR